jgi:hypothetical protein
MTPDVGPARCADPALVDAPQPGLTGEEARLLFIAMKETGVLEPTRSTRWEEGKVFAAVVNARDLASPAPNILEELFLWFKGARLYYQAEMGGVPSDQDRQRQKQMLTSLISMGEWMVGELRQHDITAKAEVTLADVEATLEGLHDSLRVSFGGMTKARRAQVLDEVFGAS